MGNSAEAMVSGLGTMHSPPSSLEIARSLASPASSASLAKAKPTQPRLVALEPMPSMITLSLPEDW